MKRLLVLTFLASTLSACASVLQRTREPQFAEGEGPDALMAEMRSFEGVWDDEYRSGSALVRLRLYPTGPSLRVGWRANAFEVDLVPLGLIGRAGRQRWVLLVPENSETLVSRSGWVSIRPGDTISVRPDLSGRAPRLRATFVNPRRELRLRPRVAPGEETAIGSFDDVKGPFAYRDWTISPEGAVARATEAARRQRLRGMMDELADEGWKCLGQTNRVVGPGTPDVFEWTQEGLSRLYVLYAHEAKPSLTYDVIHNGEVQFVGSELGYPALFTVHRTFFNKSFALRSYLAPAPPEYEQPSGRTALSIYIMGRSMGDRAGACTLSRP